MRCRLISILGYLQSVVSDGYRQPERVLGIYRIAFALFVILIKGTPDSTWLSGIPDLLYNPSVLSPAVVLAGFPPLPVTAPLTILTAIALVLVLFGYRTRTSSLALFSLLLVGNALTYSFGKINHDELMTMLVPAFMAFSGWGNAYSIDARRGFRYPNHGWPMAMIAMVLGFAMFTAGVPKLLGGWLDPDTAAVRGHVVHRVYAVGIDDYLAVPLAGVNLPVVWEILDYLVIIFEVGFLVAFLVPSVFRAWLGVAVGFHHANLLVLNISFTGNLIVYALFINWDQMLKWADTKKLRLFLSWFESRLGLLVVGTVVVLFAMWRTARGGVSENSLRAAANSDLSDGVAAPIDFVLSWLPLSWLDLNLVLLVFAVGVAAIQTVTAVKKRLSFAAGHVA